jgi:hypothetical protein
VVGLSSGDVISGLTLPIAAEIDNQPFLTAENIDPKHVLNTNGKSQ